jgi:PAS domain S-box-containing protein
MNLYSVVLDAMGSACFTVAVSEILLHLRSRGRRFSLALGIAALFTAAYCLMCAGQYNVAEAQQSVPWLRAEGFFLTLMAIAFLWFISDATGMVPRPVLWAVSAWFGMCAIVQAAGLGSLTWLADAPELKEVFLPFGVKITYREVAAGPLTVVQSVSAVFFFAYVFYVLVKFTRAGHRKEGRSLLVVVAVICAAIMNDFSVSFGFYAFLYLTEYAWLAAILLIGFERSNQVIEAAEAKEALTESEEKFRTLIEQSSEAIVLSDENGVIMEYNRAAEYLSGIPSKTALGKRIWDLVGRLVSSESSGGDPLETRFRSLDPAGHTMEGALMRPDGERRYFRQTIFPIHTKKGYRLGAIVHDMTEAKSARDKLIASLAEKNVLLREIHHRVKNNLQVISSLLYMHESRAEDPKYKAIIRECRNQVLSMALIHEDLYGSSDFRNIRFGSYIRKLTQRLMSAFDVEGKVALDFHIQDISMSIEKAIPCGLILNELCMNAFKHAFPPGSGRADPCLAIELDEREEGVISLAVSDNGVGFPKDLDFRRTPSVGMQIIMTLVRQLRGSIGLERGQGTRFMLEFSAGETA